MKQVFKKPLLFFLFTVVFTATFMQAENEPPKISLARQLWNQKLWILDGVAGTAGAAGLIGYSISRKYYQDMATLAEKLFSEQEQHFNTLTGNYKERLTSAYEQFKQVCPDQKELIGTVKTELDTVSKTEFRLWQEKGNTRDIFKYNYQYNAKTCNFLFKASMVLTGAAATFTIVYGLILYFKSKKQSAHKKVHQPV